MDLRRIRELTDAFEASDWDEIDLEIDGVRIRLSAATASTPDESSSRAAPSDESSSRPAPGAAPAGPGAGPASDEGSSRAAPLDESSSRAEEGAAAEGGGAAGGTPVVAPSPGIFWRAPSPGEPPFVDVGDRVEPDTVVGIVELMKLMNRVAAGVSGTVTAVLADNGQPVPKGGPLVLVEQD